MTLTPVRLVGGPLQGKALGVSEPLPERITGEELQDLVIALPALRASLAGGEYRLITEPFTRTYHWQGAA